MKSLLTVLVVSALALTGCNKSRSDGDEDVADASSLDVAPDLGDAQTDTPSADAEPDGPTLVDVGLPDMTPTDVAPVDVGDEDAGPMDAAPDSDAAPEDTTLDDVAPDAIVDVAIDADGPTGAPLVAYVVTVAGQQEIELVPIDASAPPRSLFRAVDPEDAAYPAFSPSGDRIAFMTVNDDNDTRVAIINTDGESEAVFFDSLAGLRVLGVDWYGDSTLAVTALVDRPAGVSVLLVSVGTGESDGAVFGASGGQVLSVHTDSGFVGVLTLEKPSPPTGELWYDGFRGREPGPVTSGLPIVGDISLIGDDEFFFVDSTPALHRAFWDGNEVTTESTQITPEGVQEYHPRPVASGEYYVSARFREGEAARPAPRDIVLVDGRTGLRVWTVTDTPTRYERHPDVQTHIAWSPWVMP
ncbi:MAG: hypothetical protein ACI81R_001446 [Bradymonadia bacterium]|jgi:hypothetical protein